MQRSFGKVSRRKCANVVHKNDLFQIEPGRIEDIPHLEAILEQSPEAASWSAKALAEIISSHASHFLLARQDKGIVGFIAGRRVGSEGEVLNLAVLPQLRRQRVAKSLVEQLLQIFAGQGISEVFLEVRQSNAAAVAFYRNFGFRQVGERPGYYRDPPESAVILSLCLIPPGSTVGTH
jgi:[ribosomal protein S18]-alanine N-acetyltransferase